MSEVVAEFLLDGLEETRNRGGVVASLLHQSDRMPVGRRFRISAIGQRQKTAPLDQQVLDAIADIARDQHDQAGHPCGAVNLAKTVFQFDMADLMRQHADEHFGVTVRKVDQFIGDDQRAVRQRERIRADRSTLPEIQRIG